MKVKSLSCVQLLATPWTAAYQAPLSMDFPGKSTGVGCHCLLLIGINIFIIFSRCFCNLCCSVCIFSTSFEFCVSWCFKCVFYKWQSIILKFKTENHCLLTNMFGTCTFILVTNILDLFLLFYLVLSTYHFLWIFFCSVSAFCLDWVFIVLLLSWNGNYPLPLGIFFKLLIQISNLKSKSYYFQSSEKKRKSF